MLKVGDRVMVLTMRRNSYGELVEDDVFGSEVGHIIAMGHDRSSAVSASSNTVRFRVKFPDGEECVFANYELAQLPYPKEEKSAEPCPMCGKTYSHLTTDCQAQYDFDYVPPKKEAERCVEQGND